MKILFYKRKDQYAFGRDYPTGKAAAHVRALTGRESLTPKDVAALKALGHVFLEVNAPKHGRHNA